VQEHDGENYKPDIVVINKNGACIIDLKNYDNSIMLKRNKVGNYACSDSFGNWFCDGSERGLGEVKQVLGYSMDLKKWVATKLKAAPTIRIGFSLCFTGPNAQPAVSKEYSDATAGSALAYLTLITPKDIQRFIQASVFGPDLHLTDRDIEELISSLKCTEFVPEDSNWLKINYASSEKKGEVKLNKALVTIGRDSKSDLPFKDMSVSTRHLEIKRSGAGLTLTDLSKNGTIANGETLMREVDAYYDFPITLELAPGKTDIVLKLSSCVPASSSQNLWGLGTV